MVFFKLETKQFEKREKTVKKMCETFYIFKHFLCKAVLFYGHIMVWMDRYTDILVNRNNRAV